MQGFFNINNVPDEKFLSKLFINHNTGEKIFPPDKLDSLMPRSLKSQDEQDQRTRRNAEVFSPFFLCREMIDELKGVEDLDSRCIEIACGEAPFIVSRYDAETGKFIDIKDRAGILDRKLKKINETSSDISEWLRFSLRAFQSVYGYELQKDSLAIARLNLFMTFTEYFNFRWPDAAHDNLYKIFLPQIADVIAWNFWQMDGLEIPAPENFSSDIFIPGLMPQTKKNEIKIKDWRTEKEIFFPEGLFYMKEKLFDFAVSNPPYQEDTVGNQKNFASPIYNFFMDSTFQIAEKVEFITPARFLFNAGGTPKAWNEKMLNDPHFKVLRYEADSKKIFRNADIKGGVAITLRNENKNFGAIGTFTAFPELNSILHKVVDDKNFKTFSEVVYSRTVYRFTDIMHKENPDALSKLSKGHAYDMSSNIFELLPMIFYDEKPNDGKEYAKFLGLVKMKRVYKWLRSDYFKKPDNFEAYKVFVPKANGSGALGEVLSTPVIGLPVIGSTETFISIGCFSSEVEAEACYKYVKTKFARTMLGILKVTQDNAPEKWRYVPLQNFTAGSDIDWSKSIPEIDSQLYKKYNLSDNEIKFIESHVKSME